LDHGDAFNLGLLNIVKVARALKIAPSELLTNVR
jgi:hypothetical protein